MDSGLLERLTPDARALLAELTVGSREIERLVMKVDIRNMDAYFAREIKEKVEDIYARRHGREIKDTERDVFNFLYQCAATAYGMGYGDALRLYSDIVAHKVEQASVGRAVRGKNTDDPKSGKGDER